MVESAPRLNVLRTGETTRNVNTAECLGYGDGGNGQRRQRNRGEKVSKTEVGSPARIRTTIHGPKGRCPTIRRPGNGMKRLLSISVASPAGFAQRTELSNTT